MWDKNSLRSAAPTMEPSDITMKSQAYCRAFYVFLGKYSCCCCCCDPIDGSPPGSPVPGILQARTLEWVAISFSSAWKWKVKVKSLSLVRLLASPWTAAYQAPPSMGFSRQECWSGLPLPSLREIQQHVSNAARTQLNLVLIFNIWWHCILVFFLMTS